MLDRDVFVLEIGATLIGDLEDSGQILGHLRLGPAIDQWKLVQLDFGQLAHIIGGDIDRLQQGQHQPLGLGHQRPQQMGGMDPAVISGSGLIPGSHQGLLGTGCQF